MNSDLKEISGDENMNHQNNEESNKDRLHRAVDHVFNDDLMMALAAILASTVILQSSFDLSEGMQAIFQYLNYFIIGTFIAEYILKLYIADSKTNFIVDTTHIFDFIIILLALLDFSGIAYLPFLPDQGQLSPILRLLRLLPRILPRVLLAFFLAGRTVKRKGTGNELTAPTEMEISALNLSGTKIDNISGHEDDIPIWIDFQNIKTENIDKINEIAKIDKNQMNTKLFNASFPRIDKVGEYLALFLWDSNAKEKNGDINEEPLKIITNNMLIIFNDIKIITLSSGKSNLFEKISKKDPILAFNKKDFTDRILYLILKQKYEDYSEIIQQIERKTIEFEEIPVDKTSTKFLEETFHFKKEILKISGNLLHFQKILDKLVKIDTIRSFGIDNSKEFNHLSDESRYLYETTQNIKENLVSLIDLHTNTVSYDMNKIMKVIAVITCLAIVPATVGGLLGVNLEEGEFNIKFIEIFFIIISSMLLGIYAFYKMEWLK